MTLVRLGLCVLLASLAGTVVSTETDLDAFMQQVVARRDDNWKKLQQYILDERETVELRGPAHVPLWGERRDTPGTSATASSSAARSRSTAPRSARAIAGSTRPTS